MKSVQLTPAQQHPNSDSQQLGSIAWPTAAPFLNMILWQNNRFLHRYNHIYIWINQMHWALTLQFNPFTVTACKMSGLKSAHIHACIQYIWQSYNKSAFNIQHFDRNLFACSCEGGEGGGSLNDFKFGTSIGCFPSDGGASMAVEGLRVKAMM